MTASSKHGEVKPQVRSRTRFRLYREMTGRITGYIVVGENTRVIRISKRRHHENLTITHKNASQVGFGARVTKSSRKIKGLAANSPIKRTTFISEVVAIFSMFRGIGVDRKTHVHVLLPVDCFI